MLADALSLTPGDLVNGSPHYFPSVRAEPWTTAGAEVRVGVLQPLTVTPLATAPLRPPTRDRPTRDRPTRDRPTRDPAPPASPSSHPPAAGVTHEVFATDVSSKSPVGVEVHAGDGHALILTCDYPAHLPFWTTLLARLGATPRHTHTATTPGIVLTSTTTPTGTRLLHALNVSPIDQSIVISHQGTPLFEGAEVDLPPPASRPASSRCSRPDFRDRREIAEERPERPLRRLD